MKMILLALITFVSAVSFGDGRLGITKDSFRNGVHIETVLQGAIDDRSPIQQCADETPSLVREAIQAGVQIARTECVLDGFYDQKYGYAGYQIKLYKARSSN
jgi:hypothetical protein